MQRESFVIFKNWVEAINKLPENEQLETYKALTEFGFNGEMPQKISYIASALLTSFSIGLKNSQIRYENSVKNGKKGGRPKRAESSCETKEDNKDKSSSAIENDENADKKLEFQENPEKPKKTQKNPGVTLMIM